MGQRNEQPRYVPEEHNRPKDRPSYKRTEKQVKKGVERKIKEIKKVAGKNKKGSENFVYTKSPIKKAALDKAVKMAGKEREQGRRRGEKYANKVLSRNYEGLTSQERQNHEEEHRRTSDRETRNDLRKVRAEQGVKGLHGRSGAAARADIHNAGQERNREFRQDLRGLNSERALKKMAAGFAIEQGEAGQSAIDRQQALEEARHNQIHKIQNKSTKKLNRSFNRI